MNGKFRARSLALVVAATMIMPALAAPAAAADKPVPFDVSAPSTGGFLVQPLPVGDTKTPVAEPSDQPTLLSREQAIAVATKAFPIPDGMMEPNVSKSQSSFGAQWTIDWQAQENAPEPMGINVSVNAVSGVILGYNRWKRINTESPSSAPAFTRVEAGKVAAEWIDKLAADIKPMLRPADAQMPSGWYGPISTNYDFRWDRLEQGYPVRDGAIYISINGMSGELESYRREWPSNLTFEPAGTPLTKVQAEAAYREKLPLLLYYQRFTRPGTDQVEWRLVYRPVTGSYPMVDQEGNLVDWSATPYDLKKLTNLQNVPAPAKPYVKPAQPLTEAQALALAQAITGKTEAPTSSSYSENSRGKENFSFWSFDWYKNSELKEGEYNVNIRIDAVTGLAQNFNSWGPWREMKEDEPRFPVADAQAKAIDLVRQFRPDIAADLTLMPVQDMEPYIYKMQSYNFNFAQRQNGILIADRFIRIEMDARTGAFRGFSADEPVDTTVRFPSARYVKDPAAVIDSFLTYQGLDLYWAVPGQNLKPGEVPSKEPPKARLIWQPANVPAGVAFMDALTGRPLDYEGRDLIELTTRPVDIAGNFAEREIELLWMRGVFDLRGGKFNPSDSISAGELARWLVLAKGMRPYPMYDFSMAFARAGAPAEAAATMAKAESAPYLGAAMQARIFLPEDFTVDSNPNDPATREQLALWAVRAMGYGAIAGMTNRIDMPFADEDAIGARFANAVGILHGLGVIKGEFGGSFNPQRLITRAEAAKIVFAVANEARWR